MSQRFPVYAEECVLGWRLIRRINVARGERMVDSGIAERCYDECGRHTAYRVVNRGRERSESHWSPAEVTARECAIYAGVAGESRTAHMSEIDRVTRVHHRDGRKLPPEDVVERVRAKVDVGLALRVAMLRGLTTGA